jgi:hypothetical protein
MVTPRTHEILHTQGYAHKVAPGEFFARTTLFSIKLPPIILAVVQAYPLPRLEY